MTTIQAPSGFRSFVCITCGKTIVVAEWLHPTDTCGDCKFTEYLRNGGYDD